VNNNLHVIEDDPLAGGKSVHRNSADAVITLESPFNRAGDRLEMRFRCSGADHEKISEGGDALKIQDDDVFCLLVGREMGAGFG
jgi:hypothetical protein